MLQRLLLLLIWSVTVLGSFSFTSNTVCTTKWATTSKAAVPTFTTRAPKTTLYAVFVKSTKVVTVTPAAVTSTTSTTSTTTNIVDYQKTDIATATSTSTITDTATSTTTSTSTSTMTTTSTSSSTTTIVAPSGFTAIMDQGDYSAQKRDAQPNRLNLEARATATKKVVNKLALPAATAATPASQYPAAVTCGITVSGFTTWVTGTTAVSTTLAPVTQTTTSVVMTSTNSTSILADATVTTTTTFGTEITSTSTVSTSTTVTQVNTAVIPASTYYAQCSSENLITHAHGLPIGQVSYSSAFGIYSQADSDSSGYSCCALCASTPDCAGFGWNPAGTCYFILTSGHCDGSQTWSDAYHYWNVPNGNFYVVGNGACGRLGAVAGEVSST